MLDLLRRDSLQGQPILQQPGAGDDRQRVHNACGARCRQPFGAAQAPAEHQHYEQRGLRQQHPEQPLRHPRCDSCSLMSSISLACGLVASASCRYLCCDGLDMVATGRPTYVCCNFAYITHRSISRPPLYFAQMLTYSFFLSPLLIQLCHYGQPS